MSVCPSSFVADAALKYDPVLDPLPLQNDMNKWDGQASLNELYLNPDSIVLEIGVGTGRMALQACKKCNELYSMDIIN